jgi:hypothetical protein
MEETHGYKMTSEQERQEEIYKELMEGKSITNKTSINRHNDSYSSSEGSGNGNNIRMV